MTEQVKYEHELIDYKYVFLEITKFESFFFTKN